ncbi:uncharacterized protein LOC121803802 [Salvia splendens]|uniref:uncharacterized protein LOC121803802 n=1 Tax=Salvia splendens TaxID=180675 RepID=UPI001C2560D0|nr:uncharacterized protein LOC121803802 [Salvia splendens]
MAGEDISRAMERTMFAFGNQFLAGIRAIQGKELTEEQAEEQVPRPIRHRTSVRREHGLAHQHLFEDYFADEDRLFFADGLGCGENYFFRLFTHMFDEYLHVGDTTGRECLVKFCEGVIDAFSAAYLLKPNAEDCQFLMRMQGARLSWNVREH